VTVNATQQFTATVANTANTAVTWQVNGTAGGNATVGTISSTGLYTAPAAVPNPATVAVTAVSVADNTKSDTSNVTITAAPIITVTVAPSTANVTANATQQFTATVTGTANTAVSWQVNNVTGGNPTVGTISGTGLYTAPASVPNPASVTVKAISSADTTVSGTASVTVVAAAIARFVYVSSYPDSKIAIFSVDNSTGLLNPTTTVSLPANSAPSFLGMHPSAKFLYSLTQGTNNVSIFTVNVATGTLTAAGSVATSSSPFYMVFSPDGSHAYVTCDTASAVLAFSVNASTGALTAVSGSPYPINGGPVRGIAITPDNKYLYVSDRDATPAAITGFTINQSTGALTKMASPFPGDFIGTLRIDKFGKYLYAGSPDDVNVSEYSINSSTGALTFVSDYPSGTSSTSVWMFDPSGTYLYGGSTADNKIFGFKQNADGSLSSIGGMPVTAATFPNGGGIHSNGKFVYVVSTISDTTLQPGVINIFSVNATTGALTLLNSTPAGVNNTIGFAITP
jgi:6-phosphogluconolactonase (cycloisomerase 2 family)